MTKQLAAAELVIDDEKLKSILALLSDLFGIRTAFLYGISHDGMSREIAGKREFRPFCSLIQTQLKRRCMNCDAKMFAAASERMNPIIYRCDNGLYEMFLAVWIKGRVAGYLHFGQVRSEDTFDTIFSECDLEQHSRWPELKSLYDAMEIVPRSRLSMIADLFQQMVSNIIGDRLVEVRHMSSVASVEKYVKENFHRRITIKNVAEVLGKSESHVVHEFSKVIGTSVHQYVMGYRISVARELLKSKTIDETFEACGFKNRYHFSRTFKKFTGQTPGQFQAAYGL